MCLSVCSCSQKELVFEKTSAESAIQLTLVNDTSFEYSAKSPIGARFLEVGTYKLQDTFLILNFKNSGFSYECFDMPLNNDTFLIVNHNQNIALFPIQKTIANVPKKFSYKEMVYSLQEIYKNGKIQLLIDNNFLKTNKLEFEERFGERKYVVSEYFDSQL